MTASQTATIARNDRLKTPTIFWSLFGFIVIAVIAITVGLAKNISGNEGVSGSTTHPLGSYQTAPADNVEAQNPATDGQESPRAGGADDNVTSGGAGAGSH